MVVPESCTFGELPRISKTFRPYKVPFHIPPNEDSNLLSGPITPTKSSPLPVEPSPPKPIIHQTEAVSTNSSPTKENLVVETNSAINVAKEKSPSVVSSWASLFQPTGVDSNTPKPVKLPVQKNNTTHTIVEMLSNFKENYKGKLLQPRGLINSGNMCFMNAILQPLVYCAPFYNLITKVYGDLPYSTENPLLEAIFTFFKDFKEEKDEKERIGSSLAPEYIYDVLSRVKKTNSIKGHQEDAEEFLGFLLDGLHEEFVKIQDKHETANIGSEDWVEVGPKNKTLVTRQTRVAETPITKLFCGKMRSIVNISGSKSSVILEPFTTLQLSISENGVNSIEDAILNLTIAEKLEDFTGAKGTRIEATKQNSIEIFPPVLILHLKRFIYYHIGGTLKVDKHISYPQKLTIKNEYLSAQGRLVYSGMEYTLFSVIYHHGKLAAGGHYTTDVARSDNSWLSIDDDYITTTNISNVLLEQPDKQAYMLFYIRKK